MSKLLNLRGTLYYLAEIEKENILISSDMDPTKFSINSALCDDFDMNPLLNNSVIKLKFYIIKRYDQRKPKFSRNLLVSYQSGSAFISESKTLEIWIFFLSFL
jgi:hypothetical protein